MKQNLVETLIGFAVIAIACIFLVYAYSSNDNGLNDDKGYVIKAKFDNVDGIMKGSDIKIGGVKVGAIDSITLDTNNYYAIVEMRIDNDVKVPIDSSVAIVSSGLIGGKYIAVSPGAEDRELKEGQYVRLTQSSVNLEGLISKFVFSSSTSK